MKARTIILIGGLVATPAAALPAPAPASSLLSGYGGPGQGNQAILGSALVNGPKGGGGAGGASGASESSLSRSASSAALSGASAGTPRSASRTSAGAARGDHATPRAARGGRQAATGESAGRSFYPASERTAVDEQPGTLALSGADLLYIVVALGVLGFIGVLTRRLARSGAARKLGS